jgi:hypothetical protein
MDSVRPMQDSNLQRCSIRLIVSEKEKDGTILNVCYLLVFLHKANVNCNQKPGMFRA